MAQFFRVERTKNFTVMNNHHFKNKNLSLKTKGAVIPDVKSARGLELQYAGTGNIEQRWD